MGINRTRRTLLAAVPLAVAALTTALTGAAPEAPRAAHAPAAPRAEARVLWVNRWEYRTEADIRRIMQRAARANLNMVYFQVRGPADAYYRSDLDPCSVRLCGRLGGTPTWDPLEVAVREAHAQGLQLHAWINALSGWDSQEGDFCRLLRRSDPGRPDHILVRHPEWAMHTREGRPMACPNGEEYVYLSPGNPGVRTHLARVAADVVRRYAVDGIHLDRIRYPGAGFGRDRASLAAFGRDPSADPAGWARFRRDMVTRTVRETADSIRAVRRVPLSAAVWPIYDRERFGWPSSSGVAQFFQDTWGWAREGALDVAVPMTYFRVSERPCTYERLPGAREPNPDWHCMMQDHVDGMRSTGRHVYIGIASGMPHAEIARQIQLGRERGVQGFSFYSFDNLNGRGAVPFLGDGPFRDKAVVPPMPWLER
jgi:uncharacterized lipoprotein YddW (UPF0748 family)